MEDKVKALKELRDFLRVKAVMLEDDQIEIGDFTYGTPIIHQWDTETKLKIGKFCSIGGNVNILMGGEHHTEWLTTYPFNVLLADQYGFKERLAKSKGDITIGNDVWIGNNVTILSGVTIGDGAVIGAGSVVTKDVNTYTIVAGNPAKEILYRMRAADVENCEWWDWPLEKIADAIPTLCSRDALTLKTYWEAVRNG